MSKTIIFFDFIIKLAQVFIVLPLAVTFWRFRYLNKVKTLLLLLLLISAFISTIARILWTLGQNNLFLLHYYTVLEFCGWISIFYFLFEGQKMKRFLLSTAVGFIIFAIFNSIFWQSLDTFNSNSRSLESVILIGFSILYYFKLFRERKILQLERSAPFWINAAVLLYFSSSFLLFGFSNLLLNLSSYKIKEVWGIHGVFLIIHYSLITIGIWVKSNQKISRSSLS